MPGIGPENQRQSCLSRRKKRELCDCFTSYLQRCVVMRKACDGRAERLHRCLDYTFFIFYGHKSSQMTQPKKKIVIHPLANKLLFIYFLFFLNITVPIVFRWLISDAACEYETRSSSSTCVNQTRLVWAPCVASPSGTACLGNPSGRSVLAMLPAPVRNKDVYIKVICGVYQMAVIWWQVECCVKWRGTDSHAPPPCLKVFHSTKDQRQTG